MGIHLQGQLGAALDPRHLLDPGPRMNPRAGRHRRREAQAVGAVVDHGAETGDFITQRQLEPRLQHLYQRAVGNGAAKRAVLACTLRIGVNPVVITRQRGEGIDQGLIDDNLVAPGAEGLTDQALQRHIIIHGDQAHRCGFTLLRRLRLRRAVVAL
ncbi:hypothetical protein D3C81_892840 [compost metagenome]